MEAKFSWLKFPWLDFKRYSIKRISNLVWKRFHASHYLLHHTIFASRQRTNQPASRSKIHFCPGYKLIYLISQKLNQNNFWLLFQDQCFLFANKHIREDVKHQSFSASNYTPFTKMVYTRRIVCTLQKSRDCYSNGYFSTSNVGSLVVYYIIIIQWRKISTDTMSLQL